MGTIGDSPCLGDVCGTPSADLGKSRLGFYNQTFLQYGCKRAFTSFRDVCWAPPADLGKSHCGFGNHAFLVSWGKIGINGRTPSAELSKPWRSS